MGRPVSERLLERLRAMGLDLPDDLELRRTNAQRADRLNGAWSWFGLLEDGRQVGSWTPMGELLRSGRLRAWRARSYAAEDIVIEGVVGNVDSAGGQWEIAPGDGEYLYEPKPPPKPLR